MHELTVTCGCGRTMRIDGTRGRGAFRCGCGARIQIAASPTSGGACSVDDCRLTSVTGATIRLCADHKDEITIILAHDIARANLKNLAALTEEGAGKWRPAVIPIYSGSALGPTEAAIVRELPESGRHEPVVYFLRNGERVKIGYSGNLGARITALSLRQRDVLLLLDGGRELESELHRRFRAHRVAGTEWFNLTEELQTFIDARPRKGYKRSA